MRILIRFSSILTIILASTMVLFTALSATAGDQVPFKSTAALMSVPAQNNAGCPVEATRMNVTGLGIASHLGTISVSEYVCLNPDLTFLAYFTITAANGDQLTGSAVGYGVPTSQTTFTIHGQWIFTGGTGRFQGATGSGVATGDVNLVTGASPHQLTGTISTVGSSK